MDKLLKIYSDEKWTKFAICIVLDILGAVSYLIPALAETSDLIFAPISGLILMALFWKYGKFKSFGGGIFNSAEELIPFTDFIPTALLLWVAVFVKDDKESFKKWLDNRKEKTDAILMIDEKKE